MLVLPELTYDVEPCCQMDDFSQAQASSIKILNMSEKNVDYPVACQCIGLAPIFIFMRFSDALSEFVVFVLVSLNQFQS